MMAKEGQDSPLYMYAFSHLLLPGHLENVTWKETGLWGGFN